jgi:hypothetical protein
MSENFGAFIRSGGYRRGGRAVKYQTCPATATGTKTRLTGLGEVTRSVFLRAWGRIPRTAGIKKAADGRPFCRLAWRMSYRQAHRSARHPQPRSRASRSSSLPVVSLEPRPMGVFGDGLTRPFGAGVPAASSSPSAPGLEIILLAEGISRVPWVAFDLLDGVLPCRVR